MALTKSCRKQATALAKDRLGFLGDAHRLQQSLLGSVRGEPAHCLTGLLLRTVSASAADSFFSNSANFGVSDRRFRFKPAGGFGGNRQAVSVQSGTPLRMGFGPGFGEPPLRDTSYLALACQSKYSCHYYSF